MKTSEETEGQRNIILLTIDSLRADYCGWMNSECELTPAIDELVQDGVSFDHAISPGPSTHDSMPQIFSGNHMLTEDIGVAKREDITIQLERSPTLPERLSDMGYSTAGFTTNVYTSRHFGYDKGFDEFVDFLDEKSPLDKLRSRAVSSWTTGELFGGLRFFLNIAGQGQASRSWRDFYDRVIDSVAELTEPFFVWIFLLEPHWPYRPSRQNRGDIGLAEMYSLNWKVSKFSDATPTSREADRLRSLYAGTVRDVDDFVRRISLDLADRDPVMILHSDHGEAFGERGRFQHGRYLYEENIHVPLVVGNAGVSSRISKPISLRQLPEVLSLVSRGEACELDDLTDWAVNSTEEGGSVCVRGINWKVYLHRDNSVTFHPVDGTGPEPAGTDVTEDSALSGLVRRVESHRDELREIAESVLPLAEEEILSETTL